MFKSILLTLFAFLLVLNSCSPVRSKYFRSLPKETRDRLGEVQNEEAPRDVPRGRFSDTTYLYVSNSDSKPISESGDLSIEEKFNRAVSEFDSEQYDSACEKFSGFSETLAYGDDLYYDSRFYLSECSIMSDELKKAESILTELLADPGLPSKVKEKSLVRLGQLYCVLDNHGEARKLFKQLENEFPESIYLQVADCGAVGK